MYLGHQEVLAGKEIWDLEDTWPCRTSPATFTRPPWNSLAG
jgi:hypothetical protein